MDEISEKMMRILMAFVLFVVLFKISSSTDIFSRGKYVAKGYAVKVPEGWQLVPPNKKIQLPQGVEERYFIPKGGPVREDGRPLEPYILIRSEKLKTPMWIEDEIPNIIEQLKVSGLDVKNKGQIKIDEQISEWVLYLSPKRNILTLDFHMVLDNGVYYRIQFVTRPEEFGALRPAFESLKNSFRFRFTLF